MTPCNHASADGEQPGAWVEGAGLSEAFYEEITQHPIPVDLRAIRALSKSPLALDIYAWLTYRVNLRADLHMKLKIRAVQERTTIGEMIEQWVENWA